MSNKVYLISRSQRTVYYGKGANEFIAPARTVMVDKEVADKMVKLFGKEFEVKPVEVKVDDTEAKKKADAEAAAKAKAKAEQEAANAAKNAPKK